MTRFWAHLLSWASVTVLSCGGSQVTKPERIVPPEQERVAPGPQPAPTEQQPTSEQAITEAISLLRSGHLEEGRDALARLAEMGGPASAVVYYNLALAEERLGRTDSAIQAARKAVEASQGAEKPVRLYMDLMLRAGRGEALASDIENMARRWPGSVALDNARARAMIEVGKPGEALSLATEALKKDETNVEVMKTIALAYLAMRKFEAARIVLTQILETKRDPEVLDLLGQMAMREGERKQAIVYLAEAVRGNPNLVDAHLNLGILYHEAGDYEAAIAEFQEAVRVEPSYWPAYMNMGNSFRKLGRFAEAEEAYQKALKLYPDCADCYFNLGVAALEYRPPGRDEPSHYKKAIEYFGKYKAMRRGPPRRDDPVDKYIDEARRMAEYLEREEQIRKSAPSAEGQGGEETNKSDEGRTEQ